MRENSNIKTGVIKRLVSAHSHFLCVDCLENLYNKLTVCVHKYHAWSQVPTGDN